MEKNLAITFLDPGPIFDGKKILFKHKLLPTKKNHPQPKVGNKNFMPHKIVFESLNIVFFFLLLIFLTISNVTSLFLAGPH